MVISKPKFHMLSMTGLIFFAFFSMATVVHAGCFAEYAPSLVNTTTPECFSVEAESCLGRLIVKNNCEDDFTFSGIGDCKIESSISEENRSQVMTFLHKDSIDIPSGWELTLYQPSWSGLNLSYVHNYSGVEVSCDSSVIDKDSFDLLLISSQGDYKIRGEYYETGIKFESNSSGYSAIAYKFLFGVLLGGLVLYIASLVRKR